MNILPKSRRCDEPTFYALALIAGETDDELSIVDARLMNTDRGFQGREIRQTRAHEGRLSQG